jgi:Uma2 family endonuclease
LRSESTVEVRVETVKNPAEQRVLLRNASWGTYERLIAEREERPVPRFSYDRGALEILSPSTEHEGIGRIVALLVEELAVEWDIDVFDAGHTTFKREDLGRGFEPDCSFYFSGNADRVRGKYNVDLNVDPPPDLVIEIDITSPSLDKLPIYAQLGVREVWRYFDGRLEILVPEESGEGYEPTNRSRVLPELTHEVLTRLVSKGLTSNRPSWVREVREWVRSGENPT